MVKKKTTKKKQPSERHKALLKRISENVRNGMSMQEAMMAEGYSESYAKSSTHLKKTDSWQTLMEDTLADEKLAKIHDELLNAKQLGYFVFPKSMDDQEIIDHVKANGIDVIVVRESDKGKLAFYALQNSQAVAKGLDMAYKLKSKYGETTIRHKFGELSDEELEEEIAGEISESLGIIEGEEEEETE